MLAILELHSRQTIVICLNLDRCFFWGGGFPGNAFCILSWGLIGRPFLRSADVKCVSVESPQTSLFRNILSLVFLPRLVSTLNAFLQYPLTLEYSQRICLRVKTLNILMILPLYFLLFYLCFCNTRPPWSLSWETATQYQASASHRATGQNPLLSCSVLSVIIWDC